MDVIPIIQSNASAMNLKAKPAVPKKPLKLKSENDVNRTTHVKDMIRKLQEKEQSIGNGKPNLTLTKMGGKPGKIPPVPDKEEINGQTSNQTLEDLKAIDEDIEKLRKQIEERDKIISALREAAEAKDKKLDNLMMEYSKLQSNGKLDLDTSQESNRATSSSPSSPPLCNGELCWTDSFVNKNYHEPVYAQLLNDHAELQKVYNDLRSKLEQKTDNSKTDSKLEGGENAINLIMAEQIRALKEREAQLIWEAEELREQNDLMEFRILELEECRKEFLDKEINEGKHRTEKIVWRERDLEEISDSGVMSLPTSEDLTSDSELGEAIRNYSPLGAVTNHSLSTSENSSSDPVGLDLKSPKKSLKSSECLQESGIFVDDCAIPTATHSKSCQTESVLDKNLLDIIDSSCDLFLSKNPGYLVDSKSDDLTTEISKLSVIQEKIQQKTTPPTRSVNTVTCPHSNSLLFYEERLAQLEDKIKIYESSGDTKDILLAKRLQKEVELAHRVKELTDKVNNLETVNKKLEEEKCEFEEAENDTRFQCQRLEIRLQELLDKNTDLELELERTKLIMTEEKRKGRKKESLECLLNKYEQRNYRMEEKEEETKQRLNMLEAAMPAILAFNMMKVPQSPDQSATPPSLNSEAQFKGKKRLSDNQTAVLKLEEAFGEKKKPRKDFEKEESPTKREKALKSKIEELEAKAVKDKIMMEEMSNTLKNYQMEEKTRKEMRTDDVDLFEEIKRMVANEVHLRAKIDRLEKREQAYMQSLEKADEIWAGMEADYKKRLQEAEDANNELQKRISLLEANQADLEKALAQQPELEAESLRKTEELHLKIEELLRENEKLKSDINQNLDEKFEEQRKFLEIENLSLKSQLREMEASSARDEKKYINLQKELQTAKQELQVAKEELRIAKQELKKEKELQEKLKKDLKEKSISVTSIESKLQTQISGLNQELSRKSKELSSLEVTVAELREEVETLENKVGELLGAIQTSVKTPEEVTIPAGMTLVMNEPKREVRNVELNQLYEERPKSFGESKFWYKIYNPPVAVQEKYSWAYELGRYPREIFLKTEKHALENYFLLTPEVEKEKHDQREEEIFQLSLKNTELQQILEKMEEESEMKDKELEELQKIALEIRREQMSLENFYKTMKGKDEKGDKPDHVTMEEKNVSADTTQKATFTSAAFATATVESSQVSSSISCLQIAFDNLQSKYRSKSIMIKSLLDELKQKGDNRDIDDFKKLAFETSPEPQMEEKNIEGHPPEVILNENKCKIQKINDQSDPEPEKDKVKVLKKSSSVKFSLGGGVDGSVGVGVGGDGGSSSSSSIKVDSYISPIKTMRKVGEDGIFLEWDISRQPDNVTGFEIKVNGQLTHRVRSSSRNKALLRPLNLKDKISICVLAITESNRLMKSSHFNYPRKISQQS